MKQAGCIIRHLLITVLLAALVTPLVHSHVDGHTHDDYFNANFHGLHTHVLNNHDQHPHVHDGHAHPHPLERHDAAHHDDPRGAAHLYSLSRANPAAELLLQKLERSSVGHTHQVLPHVHFFSYFKEENGLDTPPPDHILADHGFNQAANVQLENSVFLEKDVDPILCIVTYISLLTNIPPPAA